MLKMRVKPLAIRNNSIPNRMPLRVEMIMSSSTIRPREMSNPTPAIAGVGRLAWRPWLVWPFHLAGGWEYGLIRVYLRGHPPTPSSLLFVEDLLFGAVTKRGNVHRLEELVIVLAHEAFAAVKDIELHTFES